MASREVLKNIVRMRYGDPVQFLAVSTINASFSVTTTDLPPAAVVILRTSSSQYS